MTRRVGLDEVDQVRLVLIRGMPGSGKSTLARELVSRGFVHFETDFWFETEAGYNHSEEDLVRAHAWCLKNVGDALLGGFKVVVANVFHERRQLKPYLELVESAAIIELTGSHGSVHAVSEGTLQAMRQKWQAIDGAIKL